MLPNRTVLFTTDRVPAPAENTSLCINSPGKDPVNLFAGANALAVVPEAGGYLEAIAVNLGKFAQGAALLIILRNFLFAPDAK